MYLEIGRCVQEDTLVDSPAVHGMEMISPPIDPSKVFVLYGP